MGLRSAWPSLLVAHVVITLPYVLRTVHGALSLFDFTMLDAARTLGYSYPRALWRVLVPALAPAFFTSGMFAFLASIDNYPARSFSPMPGLRPCPSRCCNTWRNGPIPPLPRSRPG